MQYHMKVLLNSFHLNGHTLDEFHPQTQKVQPHFIGTTATLKTTSINPYMTLATFVRGHCAIPAPNQIGLYFHAVVSDLISCLIVDCSTRYIR